jgi:hypothetical protein
MNNAFLNNDTATHRYELTDGGRVFGYAEYYLFGNVAFFTHTEVNPDLKGKGYGSEVVRQALEYIREQGKQIVPICGFIAHFIRKRREYADLVTPEGRRVFMI